MEKNKRFEVFGTLTKAEHIFTIENKIMPGTLVFEALKPFPGYYDDFPQSAKPVYLYLALADRYQLDDILRASLRVQEDFQSPFDAGKGFMQVFDEKYDVLRVRHLEDYSLLEKLQRSFENQGIHFLRKAKRLKDEPVKIRIIKFFSLEQIDEGIFLDTQEENHAYLNIPGYLHWAEFDVVANKVKYNWEGSKFDAAKGAFYHHGALHEFVRIYSNQPDTDYLKELRKLFLSKMHY